MGERMDAACGAFFVRCEPRLHCFDAFRGVFDAS